MEVYLDNAATTRCLKQATDEMMKVFEEDYGNPSSLHNMGMTAESHMKMARSIIAKTLKANDKEIIFTSGGTESNSLAILGATRSRISRGKHIITTMIEHPSVSNTMKALENEGFEVTYLPVDRQGRISLEDLKCAFKEDTILVSVMMVNNEIGTIEPIERIASLVHTQSPRALFHVDAIQAYGKIDIIPGRMGIDLMSVSGHKLHGPKGSGFLYVNEKANIKPVLYGGGQEWGLRSGTENVPAIAGLGVAVKHYFDGVDDKRAGLLSLKRRLYDGLSAIEGVTFNGPSVEDGAPHILSVTVKGVRSEVLLHALEDKGIYVSAGSACSSNKPQKSPTLLAIGLDDEGVTGTVRFSFGLYNTDEDVDAAVGVMRDVVPMLLKFKRR